MIINIGSEFVDVEPLLGSEWARENPSILPYSKCNLITHPLIWNESFSAFIYGATDFSKKSIHYYLFCYTKSLKLAYMLPFTTKSRETWGLVFSLPIDGFTSEQVEVKDLDGKKVRQIEGKYRGIGTSLLVPSFYSIKNKDKVKISMFKATFQVEASIGMMSESLELSPQISKRECAWNPFLLFNRQCINWFNGQDNIRATVNYDFIREMQFRQIQETLPPDRKKARRETRSIRHSFQNHSLYPVPRPPHLHIYDLILTQSGIIKDTFYLQPTQPETEFSKPLSNEELTGILGLEDEPEDESEASSCTICCDSLLNASSDNPAVQIPCGSKGGGHIFHQACIQRWYSTSDRNIRLRTCPICRGKLLTPSKTRWVTKTP